MPLKTDSRANFVQMSTRIRSLSVASKPAALAGVAQLFEHGRRRSGDGPKISRSIAVWRIKPGSAMTAVTYVVPPATCVLADRSRQHVPRCRRRSETE